MKFARQKIRLFMFKYSLIFLFCTCYVSSFSQSNFRIVNWTPNEGLPEPTVHKMITDSLGFLWIATDMGVSRFDGTTFRQYVHGTGPGAKGFRGSEAIGIVEDSLHNLWIGTEEGLNRYNLRSDSFQHFRTPRPDTNSTSYCMPLVATRLEVVCWEITGKITAYNIYTLKRRVVKDGISWPLDSYYLLNNLAYNKLSNTLWLPYQSQILQLELAASKTTFIPLTGVICQMNVEESTKQSDSLKVPLGI